MEILDNNESYVNDIEKYRDEEDKKNIDIFTTDLYSPVVIMTHIYQKEQNTIDCLEHLVLFYLHHSLYIADN